MVNVPLSPKDYFRGVAKEARLRAKNRFFEQNPVLTDTGSALIARPGMKRFLRFGDSKGNGIRGMYDQPGTFGGDLFVAVGDYLWRVNNREEVTQIGALPSGLTGNVSMAATSNIGDIPENLFVASGGTLMCFVENGYARNTLDGTAVDNDTVRIANVYYKFTTGSVDAGTPDGTSANPWLVKLGAGGGESITNLALAIDEEGTPGETYSSLLDTNPMVQVASYTGLKLFIRANRAGAVGNSIVTTATGAMAWEDGGTMAGGGDPSWFPVAVPDDAGIIDVAFIASYVICVPAQGQGINGRFYWIEPGETVIDPLNYATAERAPDPLNGVIVFNDQFWLVGEKTTEVWYPTGDITAPMRRVQGMVFDRGAWQGTAVQVKDSMIITDAEGAVWQLGNGTKRISTPDIEERIRESIQRQKAQQV